MLIIFYQLLVIEYFLGYYLKMKYKNYLIIAILAAAAVFGACNKKETTDPFAGIENLSADASYALGMSIGADLLNNMITSYIYPNLDEFIKGLNDVMKESETRISKEDAVAIIETAFNSMMNERNSSLKDAETSFLAENARRQGINITSSGLQYEVIIEGDGPKPVITDAVLVNYEGSFTDGNVFDSSFSYGEPATFTLEDVIPGWGEGIQLMNVGSQYIFYIPSSIGYGESGYSNPWTGEVIIPPYSVLIFIVELLGINPETGE